METTQTVGKKKFYKRWWFWVLAVIVLFIIIGSSGSSSTPTQVANNNSNTAPVTQPEETIKITAVKLSEEYDANKVAADAKYKDKLLEVSGTIDSIGKDILDTPYVTLQGRQYSLFGLQCMFAKSDEAELATLSKGQSIVLQGRVSGELIGNVLAKGCKIVK